MSVYGYGAGAGGYSSYAGAASHVQAPSCKFPGCGRSCYVETYGRVHDFCGRTHAQEYNRLYGYSVGPTAPTKRKKTPASSTSRQPLKAVHHASPFTHGSDKIHFYNRGEPFYEFTNFYSYPVFIDGQTWPTTEHYFQAQKFVGTPYLEKIRNLPTPRDAFQLSRDPRVSIWRRSDWEVVKDDIMLKALRVKFSESCSVHLRDKLRSTGTKDLVEHTSNDCYWGDGGDGSGQNKLGKLLMQVRSELRNIHGPYIEIAPAARHRYTYTRDDSSILQRQTPIVPQHRLRRSNSISSLSDHRPHTPQPTVSTGSYAPGSWRASGTGHTPSHHGTKPYSDLKSTGKEMLQAAKTTAGKGAQMAKKGASKVAGAVSNAIVSNTTSSPRASTYRPSTYSASTTRSNQSSVDYNIVTNKPHRHQSKNYKPKSTQV